MKYCPKCNTETNEDYSFCTNCATQLVERLTVSVNDVVLNRSVLQQIGQVNIEGITREEIEKIVSEHLTKTEQQILMQEEIESLIRDYIASNQKLADIEIMKVEMEERRELENKRTGKHTEWDELMVRLNGCDSQIRSLNRRIATTEYEIRRSRPTVEFWPVMFFISLVGVGFIVLLVLFSEQTELSVSIVAGFVVAFYLILFLLVQNKVSSINRGKKRFQKKKGEYYPRIDRMKNQITEAANTRAQTANKLERLSAEIRGLDRMLGIPHDGELYRIADAPDIPMNL